MQAPPEKLGSFYLGAEYDLKSAQRSEQPITYDARDLTTHAVCVGMTGSGKTGLCLGLLEEAALDLGCTPFDAFRSVTLPIIAPAVISGWLLAFTLSLDDLVIASFVAGPSATTLPIKIFSSVRLGVSPEINALSTLMIGIVTVAVIIASLISKRAIARQQADEQAAVRG